MQTIRSFVGMDVHKATISISVAEEGRSGPVRFLGVIPNQPDDIAKMAKRLAKHGELDFCYEASSCGYNRRCRSRRCYEEQADPDPPFLKALMIPDEKTPGDNSAHAVAKEDDVLEMK